MKANNATPVTYRTPEVKPYELIYHKRDQADEPKEIPPLPEVHDAVERNHLL